jgi:hypothetical protein
MSRLYYVRTEVLVQEVESFLARPHRWWHGLWRAVTAALWLLNEEEARAQAHASLLRASRDSEFLPAERTGSLQPSLPALHSLEVTS